MSPHLPDGWVYLSLRRARSRACQGLAQSRCLSAGMGGTGWRRERKQTEVRERGARMVKACSTNKPKGTRGGIVCQISPCVQPDGTFQLVYTHRKIVSSPRIQGRSRTTEIGETLTFDLRAVLQIRARPARSPLGRRLSGARFTSALLHGV